MFKSIARFGAAIIAACTFSLPAAASTFSIDYSDLWGGGSGVPNEAGWGLNLIQQGDVIFATMFVYGSDNTPRWFSATLAPTGGSTNWTGALDSTTGPFYGAAWNNGAVTHNQVGTMNVSFSGANAGTLSYTASGVTVNKPISRFNFRTPNLAGNYIGGAVGTCTNGSGGILIFDQLQITQTNNTVSMVVNFFNNSGQASRCTYNGNIATTGRTGSISGTYSCTVNNAAANNGTFNITNLESSINGFNANYSATDQFCAVNGRFGGVKDVQ